MTARDADATGKLCFVIGLYQFGGCLCLSDEGKTSRLQQIPQSAVELRCPSGILKKLNRLVPAFAGTRRQFNTA
jgi:hypothetical protein